MRLSVVKFGGSSFMPHSRYLTVAHELANRARKGESLVVVVSAPSGMTEAWREGLLAINPVVSDRVTGGLLPRADTVGAFFLMTALEGEGIKTSVITGNGLGILTDSNYIQAGIISVDMTNLMNRLAHTQIVVVPGGQGENSDHEITWLGKNSSDFSAVLLAQALGLKRVDIHSDVEGIYAIDPSLVRNAPLLHHISYEDAMQMSLSGAKVLHYRAVQKAKEGNLEIVCRANRSPFQAGSIVGRGSKSITAIIPDFKSSVYSFKDEPTRQKALSILRQSNSTAIPLTAEETGYKSSALAITCGYFNAQHLFKERQIPYEATSYKILTVLTDGQATRSLWRDDGSLKEAAIKAFRLHYSKPNDTPPQPKKDAVI